MTFTYTPAAAPGDVTWTRYLIGDRVEDTAWFSDEEINMAISVKGSVSAAAVSLMQEMLREISREPDLKADWLSANWGGSVKALERQLADLRAEFGIAARTGKTVATYRSDSDQTEAPDW